MVLRPPSPGLLIDGKYRLAERIGGGGMGEVYRADHALAGRVVAIKFLRSELAEDQDFGHRFFQEAQAVNRIRHANIVDVLDAGVGEAGPYIVMEYLEGEPVNAALRRIGHFTVDAAIATTLPVLDALEAAHRVGIIHRDLKPENVFFAHDPASSTSVVRLLDFGIAKFMTGTGQSPRTRTGIVFGTPDYLSPEQATGELLLDGRSDLFTVGVLLFELISGKRPFHAPSAVATAFKVVHADTPTLASVGVTVDPKLESIVQQLLEKSPAKRFPTAADAARELAQLSPSAEKRAAALARIRASSARHGDRTTPSRGSLVRPRPATNPNGDAVPPGRSTSSLAAGRQPGWNPTPQPGRSVRRDTTPTPISQRPAGAYSVRGPVLRGVDYALVAASDTFARNTVVAQMPEKYAADFRDDCINVLVSYELEALDAFMDLATTLVLRDVTQWRALGHEALTELEVALCTALQPAKDLSTAVRRGVHGWSHLLDFGQWHVEPHETGTTLRVTGLDPASLALRLWLVGLIEETLRRVLGPSTRVVVTRGEASYAAELICEIR